MQAGDPVQLAEAIQSSFTTSADAQDARSEIEDSCKRYRVPEEDLALWCCLCRR